MTDNEHSRSNNKLIKTQSQRTQWKRLHGPLFYFHRDIFSTLKLLRLEVELRPPATASSAPRIKRRRSLLSEHPRRRRPRRRQGALLPASRRDSKLPVLQECVSHENVPALGFIATATIDPLEKYQINQHKSDLTALHLACASPSDFWDVERLCASGCGVNRPNIDGKTPLHILLTGELLQKGGGNQSSWRNLVNAVKEVVKAGAGLSSRDSLGETPLLAGLRRLLGAGEYERAAELGHLLIEAGSDPDAVNDDGRSALTYSVHYLDDSVALTRLLLNCGASVWSGCGTGAEGGSSDRAVCSGEEGAAATTSDRDQSAFTWFLRAVIRRRRVEHCSETLALLSQVMGECPRRMHSHVLRTMFRHVKCYKILGPVFYQLKLSMMRYWTQPHDLRYLCWRTLRQSLRPGGHLVSGAAKLGLPKPVQQYLLMET